VPQDLLSSTVTVQQNTAVANNEEYDSDTDSSVDSTVGYEHNYEYLVNKENSENE
jgi:hypothetical protein